MAKGVFLFKDSDGEEPSLITKYISPDQKGIGDIDADLLYKISQKHGMTENTSNIQDTLSYRTSESKYFSIYIWK